MEREEARMLLQSQIDYLTSCALNLEAELMWKEQEAQEIHDRIDKLKMELRGL